VTGSGLSKQEEMRAGSAATVPAPCRQRRHRHLLPLHFLLAAPIRRM